MSNRILVIGDLHLPCVRPGYMQFCKDLRKKHKTNQTIFIGDICDNHAISFHAKHPEMPGPTQEYELAYQHIQQWYKEFHPAKIVLGNHDSRIIRLAESVAIPSKFLRDYAEIWNTPKWKWGWEFVIDDICYQHGISAGATYPAYNTMRKFAMSVVLGHFHHACGIKWLANPYKRLFGLDVGAGIDDKSMAFAYGKHTKIRSVIAAATVIDGMPQSHVMPCGAGEKYHDSKFK